MLSWWRASRGADPAEPEWATYVANVRAGLMAADRWAAPSGAFRDEVETLYAPPTRGEVIWSGLDAPGDATPKKPYILAAGRAWDPAKNVIALAEAARRVPWPLRIAGPFAAAGEASAYVRRASGIAWLGELTRTELLAQMRDAAIFAAPAVHEPFGLTVLEAGLAGCALVLADIATFRELWDGAALFVDPRDRRMIESALTRLVCDRALRRDLQREAAARARRYSLAAMRDAYCALYGAMSARPAIGVLPDRPPIEARP